MNKLFLIPLVLLASSCNSRDAEIRIDQTFDAEMARLAISQALPNAKNVKIYAACGPSAGKGLYDESKFQSWQPDGIGDGRLIFFSAADGSGSNVAFRDASGSYTFALKDGAEVRTLGGENSMWIVSYSSTGVVETHNLVLSDGQLIDLWTSNKPSVAVWGPSAKIFTSKCFRP